MDRPIPSETVEHWMAYLRRQRSRANDMIWLIEGGATFHDGRNGEPTTDATARWLAEQRDVVREVNGLLSLYEDINS